MKKDYSKYIVVYIDALGTKDRANNFEKSFYISTSLAESQQSFEDAVRNITRDPFLKTFRFSDTMILFYELKNEIHPDFNNRTERDAYFVMNMIWMTSTLQQGLFNSNILTRGSITIGSAYCDKESDYYFGPAFIRAYELENQRSIFPRVIIDPLLTSDSDFKEKLDESINKFAEGQKDIKSSARATIKKDFDGLFYVDFLQDIKNMLKDKSIESVEFQRTLSVIEDSHLIAKDTFKDEYDSLLKTNILSLADIGKSQKLAWLTSQFD